MEVNSKSGSNLTKVIWRIETLNAVGDSNGGVTKVTWRIQNFSRIKDRKLCSENFAVGGNKWNIVIYPKGDNKSLDHLSIYLHVADSATLPSGWTRFAHYGLAVIDQIDRRNSITRAHASPLPSRHPRIVLRKDGDERFVSSSSSSSNQLTTSVGVNPNPIVPPPSSQMETSPCFLAEIRSFHSH
ncbi:hypothetical protein V6N11_070318 [Hibiscus sabdariffa]|uniref:MATH domain-containing protein n=1 Tax=Hibiscus sabdariffa TaxID=183260 RepID=A0ABR2QEM6_9ROSI